MAPRLLFFRKIFNPPLLLWPEENNIFVTRFKILKKQPPEVFLKNPQNWKENTRFFSSVYFSLRANISFQLSVYQVIFLNLKNLFSHCFSIFFPFHKLQLCSYICKFWYIYIIGIRINKEALRLFQPSPHLLYFIEFSNSLFIKTPCLFMT